MKKLVLLLFLSVLMMAPLSLYAVGGEGKEEKKEETTEDKRKGTAENSINNQAAALKEAAEKRLSLVSTTEVIEEKSEVLETDMIDISEGGALKLSPKGDAWLGAAAVKMDEKGEEEDLFNLTNLERRIEEAEQAFLYLTESTLTEEELLNFYKQWVNKYERYNRELLEAREKEGLDEAIVKRLEELVKASYEVVGVLEQELDILGHHETIRNNNAEIFNEGERVWKNETVEEPSTKLISSEPSQLERAFQEALKTAEEAEIERRKEWSASAEALEPKSKQAMESWKRVLDLISEALKKDSNPFLKADYSLVEAERMTWIANQATDRAHATQIAAIEKRDLRKEASEAELEAATAWEQAVVQKKEVQSLASDISLQKKIEIGAEIAWAEAQQSTYSSLAWYSKARRESPHSANFEQVWVKAIQTSGTVAPKWDEVIKISKEAKSLLPKEKKAIWQKRLEEACFLKVFWKVEPKRIHVVKTYEVAKAAEQRALEANVQDRGKFDAAWEEAKAKRRANLDCSNKLFITYLNYENELGIPEFWKEAWNGRIKQNFFFRSHLSLERLETRRLRKIDLDEYEQARAKKLPDPEDSKFNEAWNEFHEAWNKVIETTRHRSNAWDKVVQEYEKESEGKNSTYCDQIAWKESFNKAKYWTEYYKVMPFSLEAEKACLVADHAIRNAETTSSRGKIAFEESSWYEAIQKIEVAIEAENKALEAYKRATVPSNESKNWDKKCAETHYALLKLSRTKAQKVNEITWATIAKVNPQQPPTFKEINASKESSLIREKVQEAIVADEQVIATGEAIEATLSPSITTEEKKKLHQYLQEAKERKTYWREYLDKLDEEGMSSLASSTMTMTTRESTSHAGSRHPSNADEETIIPQSQDLDVENGKEDERGDVEDARVRKDSKVETSYLHAATAAVELQTAEEMTYHLQRGKAKELEEAAKERGDEVTENLAKKIGEALHKKHEGKAYLWNSLPPEAIALYEKEIASFNAGIFNEGKRTRALKTTTKIIEHNENPVADNEALKKETEILELKKAFTKINGAWADFSDKAEDITKNWNQDELGKVIIALDELSTAAYEAKRTADSKITGNMWVFARNIGSTAKTVANFIEDIFPLALKKSSAQSRSRQGRRREQEIFEVHSSSQQILKKEQKILESTKTLKVDPEGHINWYIENLKSEQSNIPKEWEQEASWSIEVLRELKTFFERVRQESKRVAKFSQSPRLVSQVPLLKITQDLELARLASQIEKARLNNDLKTEVALRFHSAQRQEKIILEEEKKAIDLSGAPGADLMGSLIQSVKNLHFFWQETQELYAKEKDSPPYWFPSYWKSELETAAHQTRWWEARENYYRAQHAELLAYAALKEGLDLLKSSTLKIGSTSNPWDKIIEPALEGAELWKKAFDSCRAGLSKAQESFQKEWREMLPEIIGREAAWFQTLSWYAEQGERLEDPQFKKIEAQRPYLYATPSMPSVVSAYELKQFGNAAQLLSHKEFSDPSEKRKVHVRVLKTADNETPYVRLEEIIDEKLGVVDRKEMTANDLLIKLPKGANGANLETIKRELVKQYNVLTKKSPSRPELRVADLSLKKITTNMSFYRLHFSTNNEQKLEDAWEGLFDAAKEKNLQPEPTFFLESCNATHPNDDKYVSGDQWNLNGPRGIKAPEAWFRLQQAGQVPNAVPNIANVKVAVLDTGIDSHHPDLRNNISPKWYNLLKSSEKPVDNNGHGTKMAGIIGAEANNNFGIAGIAWKAQLIDFKLLEKKGESINLIGALGRAIDERCEILNCSFKLGAAYSPAVREAISKARAAGIILVTSAGNGVTQHEDHDDRPYHYPSFYKYTSPLDDIVHDEDGNPKEFLDNIVIVAASERESDGVAKKKLEDGSWFYSYIGPKTVDIAAPGKDILTTIPSQRWNYWDNPFGGATGTSPSAAHVTASLAIIKAYLKTAYPLPADMHHYRYDRVISLLMEGADCLPILAPFIKGPTITHEDGRQTKLGGRRLNLDEAVQKAINYVNENPASNP